MAADNSSALSGATKNVLKAFMKKHDIPPMLQRKFLLAAEEGRSLLEAISPKIETQAKSSQISLPPLQHKVRRLSDKPSIRLKSKILEMGAYEREKFRPSLASILSSKEKEKLQNIMTFGKDVEPNLTKMKPVAEDDDDDDDLSIGEVKFREILKEIEERQEFLRDMTKLGKRNQFAAQIEFEIKQRIRELEVLDINKVRAAAEKCHHLSKNKDE